MLLPLLFAANIISTLGMFGLIWFVQVVHYPLFLRASPATFIAFETEHANRVTWIALPLMSIELATATLMLWPHLRPALISRQEAALGLVLVLVTWASTVFFQVPLHRRLHCGFDCHAIQRLVATNWLRTVAWTARAVLLGYWITRLVAACTSS